MKRLLLLAAALLVSLGASAHRVKNLEILVELRSDGAAQVTEEWSVSVTSDATEWYVPVGNLGQMTLDHFQVYENGQAFENLGHNWDTGRSRREKTGRCGIVPKGAGMELCWGLGDPGEHLWRVTYRLTGLVQGYDDADGFNFQFINKGMANPPEKARLTIRLTKGAPALTYDNTRVWAFGFDGDIDVKGGVIVAGLDSKMTASHSMTALVRFEKGLFKPALTHPGESFETLKEKALEDSSYGDDDVSGWALLPFALFFGGGFFLLLYLLISVALGYKYKTKFFGVRKIDGWYRDIPLEGNLFAAQYLLQKGSRLSSSAPASNLIGALFLRWVMNGALTVQPDPRSAKRVNLFFTVDSVSGDPQEDDLFRMALEAAGENRLLEKSEFERWSKRHYHRLSTWPDDVLNNARRWFRSKGYFEPGKQRCTVEGAEQARHLIEFKNMLKNFTLSDQRSANEVLLWKEYLVFAQLLGIADQVAKQFQKLYPAEFEELARERGLNTALLLNTMSWTNRLSTKAYSTAATKAGKADGTGGHASFGGGGGFSGGGFGGGAR